MKRFKVLISVLAVASVFLISFMVLSGCKKSIEPPPPDECEAGDEDCLRWKAREALLDSIGSSNDAKWDEIRKARQQEYIDMKFGMFIHYSMSTYERADCEKCYSVMGEWGSPNVDPAVFNPTPVRSHWDSVSEELEEYKPKHSIDCGQWARTAKAAGCKYMILTTKHHDGFCLWPSKYSAHGIKYCGHEGIKDRDIVKEFADSARAYGLKPGFYFSIWDKTVKETPNFNMDQFDELLDTTVYGKVECLWFDGWSWMMGYRRMPYTTLKRFMRYKQPYTLCIDNNHLHSMDSTDIMVYEFPVEGLIPATNPRSKPGEGAVPLRGDDLWFWHPKKEDVLKSAEQCVGELIQCNTGHGNYLLDVTPDQSGNLAPSTVKRMMEIGELWENNPWK